MKNSGNFGQGPLTRPTGPRRLERNLYPPFAPSVEPFPPGSTGFLYFGEIFNLYTKIECMDVKAIDKALNGILKKREELAALDYSNPKYDDLEEQLHDMEDDFQEAYGKELENVLQNVHNDICPENDVLMPIAYLGKGVPVETDKYAGKDTKLILTPDPTRIILAIGNEKEQVVWSAK